MNELAKMIKGDLCDLFNKRPRSAIGRAGIALGTFGIVAGAILCEPLTILTSAAVVVACASGDKMNRQTRPQPPQ